MNLGTGEIASVIQEYLINLEGTETPERVSFVRKILKKI